MPLITQPPVAEAPGMSEGFPSSHYSDAPTRDPLHADDGSDEQREPGRKRRSARKRRHIPPEQTLWRSESTGQPLATALLAVLIIGAPQLLGGVTYWAVQLIAWMSLVCFGVLIWRAPAARGCFSGLGLVLLGVCLWTCVQAMPLPCGWVEWFSPESAAAARVVAKLVQRQAAMCKLSLGPAATQVEIVKAIAVFATFNACWLYAASGGRRRLLWMIAGSSLAISAVALAHFMLDVRSVFGVYEPKGLTVNWPLSPLMNPNNMGGFAALGVPMWIGLTHHADNPRVRLLGYVAIAITAAIAVLSLSRGAIGQLIVSLLVMIWFVVRDRRAGVLVRNNEVTLREISAVAALAVGVGLSALFAGESVLRALRSDNYDKLELITRAAQFAWNHGLTGVGRGAFGSAFTSATDRQIRFRFAENFVVQWAADWGIPVAGALLIAVLVALYASFKHPRESLARFGAYVGLIAWAAQNLVDLGFELSGISVVASSLLAACVAPSLQSVVPKNNAGTHPTSFQKLGLATLVCGMLGIAYLGASIRPQSLSMIQGQLRDARERSDRTQFAKTLRFGLTLHPREPTLVLVAAAESLAHQDPKTLVWLNHAMTIAPGWARSHELAYLWLWQTGSGRQALLELKAAAELDSTLAANHACKLGAAEMLWAFDVAPHNDEREKFLDQVSACLSRAETSQAFDELVLQEFPSCLQPLIHTAQRVLADGRGDESLAVLERARRAHPEWQYGIIYRQNTLFALQRFSEVLDEISRALPSLDVARQILLLDIKARALSRMGAEEDLIQNVLIDIRRRSSTDAKHLANSYLLEGSIHMEHGEPGQALAAYREAYRINDDMVALRAVAHVAEGLDDRRQALWAYITLCQREPGSDSCDRRDALLKGERKKHPR